MKELSVSPTPARFTSHSVNMTDRKKASLSGVVRVESAAPAELVLTTCMGRLTVCGSGLKIVKFDESDGALSFTGSVVSLKYSDGKTSLLKRIFR